MNTNRIFDINRLFHSRFRWIFIVPLAILAFFLITEHTAHFFGFLPYTFLLLCPLMHLFMHGGHNGHQNHKASEMPKEKTIFIDKQ